MPIEPDDWRLATEQDHLKGRCWHWQAYVPPREDWDHDHCSFCGAKFMVAGTPETLHEGYTTEDAYHWICQSCFEDFREMFGWEVTG